MERLRDIVAPTDPVLGCAAEIARAVPRAQDSPAREHRVWSALSRAPATPPRLGTRFGASLRAPVAAAVILGMAAAATAGVLLASARSRRVARVASSDPSPAIAAPPRAGAPSPPRIEAMAVALDPRPHPAPIPKPSAAARPPVASADEESQAAILIEAMKALRQQHDAARASLLLDGYLSRYPRGLFKEEALALDIEADSTLESPRAAVLAEEYLASYPNGRFVSAAQVAKERFGQ